MKKVLFLALAAASFTFASCESKTEQAAEQTAENVEAGADATAEKMEEAADSTREAGEAQAEAIEEAPAAEGATTAPAAGTTTTQQ
ncbi:hypothetical protein [Solirubrum puertoriconensis]|uniref:Entericidin EcnAB n=1 Tax=Solirubrum puertoriconensis TaxID=1751427 RepID=A0A9X0HI16_SOLP1|nr:hypothetical protein [Solirubrum puertoriconensis]KUG06300.1 hypothetical protein ASU33_02780 [Solirubrum puertoriconensis]